MFDQLKEDIRSIFDRDPAVAAIIDFPGGIAADIWTFFTRKLGCLLAPKFS